MKLSELIRLLIAEGYEERRASFFYVVYEEPTRLCIMGACYHKLTGQYPPSDKVAQSGWDVGPVWQVTQEACNLPDSRKKFRFHTMQSVATSLPAALSCLNDWGVGWGEIADIMEKEGF